MQAECSSVGECGIITENIAQGETTLAKKKPLKKDRKAGREMCIRDSQQPAAGGGQGQPAGQAHPHRQCH